MVFIKRDPYYLRSTTKTFNSSFQKIRVLNNYTWPNLCIPLILFQKLLHQIFKQLKIQYKLEKSASIVLLEATELYLIQLFTKTNKVAIHNNKITITTKVQKLYVFIFTIIYYINDEKQDMDLALHEMSLPCNRILGRPINVIPCK
jgi:histone H3/H4